MRHVLVVAAVLAAAALSSAQNVEVLWDTYGVPHVFADTPDALAFGYGYAQARDHASTLLRFVGVGRGRAAEYWGEKWRLLDQRTLSQRIPQYTASLYAAQNPEAVASFEAFAEGFSQYLAENPGDVRPAELLNVLPVTGLDFFGHGMRVYFEFTYAGGYSNGNLPADRSNNAFKAKHHGKGVHYAAFTDWQIESREYEEFKDAFGSNAWAINGPKSDGSAKIDMNPHLPYGSFFRWYEAHLVVENDDYDVYGTGFVGLPNLQIGFNKYLGWTHTVNKGQAWTTYLLELVNENQYYLDGQLLTLKEDRVTHKIKQEDGTIREETIVIESSVHGDITQRNSDYAIAVRLAGTDRPDPLYQWTQMSKARNMEEFKDAMRPLQISMFTTVMASRDGDIMAVFNGYVPRRSLGDWNFWNRPVPGNSSLYLWTELHSWDELPRVENPAAGFVQNCNEPPWTHAFPLYQRGANPDEYPPYMSSPPSMGFRPQASVRLLESANNMTFEKFSELKHSTLKEYANHVVDDLVEAIAQYGAGELDLQQAARILANWDRTYDADASGAALFDSWRRNVVGQVFVNGWSDQDYLGTPNTLANPAAAVEAVREAIRTLRLRGIALDAGWGAAHRFPDGRRPELTYPGHGDSDTFRNVWWGGNTYLGPVGGDSFVCIAEFKPDGPRAKTLMGYGNATPESRGGDVFAHVGDQWELFARKELKDVRLTRTQIEANLEERASLTYKKQ